MAIFASASFGQTSGGGQVGGGNLFVPIDMDDPYSIDKNFVTSLVADLYGEQFNFTRSMLWIGEHVGEDLDEPRALVLSERVSEGVADIPVDPDEVLFTELARYPASWSGYEFSSTFGSFDGDGFTYDYEGYSDVVSGWIDNSNSVSRLVVGMVYVVKIKITSPTSEVVEFYMERFYPVKRFYNEGQADSYAYDIASTYFSVPSEQDPLLEMSGDSPQMGCSVYLTQWYKDWCACVNRISNIFDAAMRQCVLAPSINDMIRNGGIMAGGTFGAGQMYRKAAKKILGPWGTFGPAVVAFIGGSGVTYGYQRASCELTAKATRDRDVANAGNELDRVAGTDENFSCPVENN